MSEEIFNCCCGEDKICPAHGRKTGKLISGYVSPVLNIEALKSQTNTEIDEVLSKQANLMSNAINYRLMQVGIEAEIDIRWFNILHEEENPFGRAGNFRIRIIAGDVPFVSRISEEERERFLKSVQ